MQELPLPALSVREFRGLKSLDIPELSKFTLIAGDNSLSKTAYAETEISWTSDERDARRNAAFLRQAKGHPAIAIVASHLWDLDVD